MSALVEEDRLPLLHLLQSQYLYLHNLPYHPNTPAPPNLPIQHLIHLIRLIHLFLDNLNVMDLYHFVTLLLNFPN